MSAQNDQEETLTELVVREAVGIGMETPMRESILEAVDEAEGRSSGSGGSLPLAGGMFGLGAALGYLAGRESESFETPSLEEFETPEAVEDVEEQLGAASEGRRETTDGEDEPASGSSRLPWLIAAAGAVAAIALLRRRRSGDGDEEWEPIEEFEPVPDEDEEAESAEAGVDETSEE